MRFAISLICLATALPSAAQSTPTDRMPPANRLTGFISGDYFTLTAPGFDAVSTVGSQFLLAYDLTPDARWKLNLNMRDRRSLSSNRSSSLYIFDAKAIYRADRWAAAAGRMSIYDIGSIGTLDGGKLDLSAGRWILGGFAGYVPDLRTAAFDRSSQVAGAFATYATDGGTRSDVAFAQLRHLGLTERRFLSVQNFVSIAPGTSLYQNAEYELSTGIPSANRLSRLMAAGSAALSASMSASGSFSFGRSIDYRRILMETPEGGLITDPAVIGTLYYENANLSLRYKLTKAIWLSGGGGFFRRSQGDLTTKQVRVGVSGSIPAPSISFSANYARSFDATSSRAVYYATVSRAFGGLSVDFSYSSYGDTVSLIESGTAFRLTPVAGYQIFGTSVAYRLASGFTVLCEVQRAKGEGADYTTFFLRSMYRFR